MRGSIAVAATAATLLAGFAPMTWAQAAEPPPASSATCVPQAGWVEPSKGTVPGPQLLQRAAGSAVVMLGERHDSAEQHRWQLQTLAGLHAYRPDLVIGMEMFPRRVQPALDRWIAGETTERQFLEETDWRTVWGYDSQLYMPILHFARMNRIPVTALNVERALTSRVGKEGWTQVPADQREGIGDPAAASEAYTDFLADIYAAHGRPGGATAEVKEDPAFQRFRDVQVLWDRAFAEGLAAAHRKAGSLAVGIIGGGHLENRHGVPHQLNALGLQDNVVLLPWAANRPCADLTPALADAVFGVSADPETEEPSWRPRLGVSLAPQEGGIRIESVANDSVASAAGLQTGDIILAAAGTPTSEVGKLVEIVSRQAPGTWLPLSVRREGATREVVAKFPGL
ncbi:putative iron-regulated protein [Skermanella aerolata]|uniref:ChaN family lipoprotein n=1 Tax=Skermanella aerolata TaxID=393310 RepID=UPI0014704A93|nr:ChaN family lipoprotein [Skermanella aerolata]